MLVHENISLLPYNTFGLDYLTNYLVEIRNEDDLHEAYSFEAFKSLPKMVLGGGSNVLFTGNQQKAILLMKHHGFDVMKEDHESVWVKVGAGELWHQLVLWSIERGLGGLENLSLIPGTVGAAPMQNIGAYGVEQMHCFVELEAFDIKRKEIVKFRRDACQFGYRHSVFKTSLKGQYVVVSVTYRLSKKPKFDISYGAIKDTLDKKGVSELSIRSISEAVIAIRQSKLPDPAIIGNAGSFFKNPMIEIEHYDALKEVEPNIPSYMVSDKWTKIPAAWLIERSGWKGKRRGKIGVHEYQPLVLVNYGGGDGKEILKLSSMIQTSVQKQFGIELQREVNVV